MRDDQFPYMYFHIPILVEFIDIFVSIRSSSVNDLNGSDAERDIAGLLQAFLFSFSHSQRK